MATRVPARPAPSLPAPGPVPGRWLALAVLCVTLLMDLGLVTAAAVTLGGCLIALTVLPRRGTTEGVQAARNGRKTL